MSNWMCRQVRTEKVRLPLGARAQCWEQSIYAQATLRDSQCSQKVEQHPGGSVRSYTNIMKKLNFNTMVYNTAWLARMVVLTSSELVLHSLSVWWQSTSAYKTCCFILQNLVPSTNFCQQSNVLHYISILWCQILKGKWVLAFHKQPYLLSQEAGNLLE